MFFRTVKEQAYSHLKKMALQLENVHFKQFFVTIYYKVMWELQVIHEHNFIHINWYRALKKVSHVELAEFPHSTVT